MPRSRWRSSENQDSYHCLLFTFLPSDAAKLHGVDKHFDKDDGGGHIDQCGDKNRKKAHTQNTEKLA